MHMGESLIESQSQWTDVRSCLEGWKTRLLSLLGLSSSVNGWSYCEGLKMLQAVE